MLYDHKRWDKKIKTNPLTPESLIEWLEKKPADKAYNYNDCTGGCLYGQYMASHGIKWLESGGCGFGGGQKREDFCIFVYDHVASKSPWTFGAALERARKAAGK